MIDDTADIEIAAANTRMSKTSDFGSGCSADGNVIIQRSIYDRMVQALEAEGGYLCNNEEKALVEKAMWDENGNRTFSTIACRPQQTAEVAGFSIPGDRKFLMVENQGQIGRGHKFSKEKLTTLLALYHFETFDEALDIVRDSLRGGRQGAFLRHLLARRRGMWTRWRGSPRSAGSWCASRSPRPMPARSPTACP